MFTIEQVKAMMKECTQMASKHVRDNRIDHLRNDYWLSKNEALELVCHLDDMQERFYDEILNNMFSQAGQEASIEKE